VRKGNPKGIRSLEDLTGTGIYLIDVNGEGSQGLWEDLAGKKGLISDVRKKIALAVETNAEAIERWKAAPMLDAWITFQSRHHRLKEITDLVKLPRMKGSIGERRLWLHIFTRAGSLPGCS
jgi:accessory colonization factor AcfC